MGKELRYSFRCGYYIVRAVETSPPLAAPHLIMPNGGGVQQETHIYEGTGKVCRWKGQRGERIVGTLPEKTAEKLQRATFGRH
jgi:hypothetical protein